MSKRPVTPEPSKLSKRQDAITMVFGILVLLFFLALFGVTIGLVPESLLPADARLLSSERHH
jgi:hypothetical protein